MRNFISILFILITCIYSSSGQPPISVNTSTNIAVNHWIKGWSYNPDGTVIIKYAVGVRNISSTTQCDLNILADVIGADAMTNFAGSDVVSVKQTATAAASPAGCYNNNDANGFTGDGDQSDVTSGAYLKLKYVSKTGCCGDGCLCAGQTVEVCYNVVLDGVGLPAMPSKDNITSYVRARFGTVGNANNNTDFSDPFDKNNNGAKGPPTNNEGDNGDLVTSTTIFQTCSHLGVAQDIYKDGASIENKSINPASDGTYTFTWIYTMCNYAPDGSGLAGCPVKDFILKDSLEKYIPVMRDFEVTNVAYTGGPMGGNLTSGVRSMADINADISGGVQPVRFIDGGFINSGGCDTLKVDILVTPQVGNKQPCKSSFESNYSRATAPSVCGKDDAVNTTDCSYCDGSTRGTNPDPNDDGPGDNCNGTRVKYNYTNKIGLIKTVTNIEPNTAAAPANGNLDITFEMTVKNTGDMDLKTMVLEDDVHSQLSADCHVQVLGIPTVTNITATALPLANNSFTGIGTGTSIDLLSGTATDLVKPGEEFKVSYVLEVDPNNCASSPDTETNQATTKGTDPCDRIVTDLSDDDSYTEDDGTSFLVSAVLPVELTGFNVETQNCQSILKWATASEQDNNFFAIEYSVDGRTFQELDRVNGQGSTNLINLYSFTHKNPNQGQNYYRLKQVDFDGAFEYSKIVFVEGKCVEYPLSIFPNPINIQENLILQYQNISSTEKVLIIISDIRGNAVKVISRDEGGNQPIEVDLTAFPAGIYFIKDNLGNFERLSIVD